MEEDVKEQRIRKIAPSYYSRKDVIEAIYKFSQNREIAPSYMMEGFGKRPDMFQYPNDIISLVKKGATSFHCSEELWSSPLEVQTGMSNDELNNLRQGWDLIIDIDCKWIDYSKKAAMAIVKSLELKGVKNIGIKFSGNKGMHIIIPWKAFPEKIGDKKTSDMFPEWPRAIIAYLKEISNPILEEMIKDMKDDFSQIKGFTGIKCENCKNLASENFLITLRCNNHFPPYIESFKTPNKNYSIKKCPLCNTQLTEVNSEKFYYCPHCELNSLDAKNNFNPDIQSVDIFKLLGLDLQLVSPRHLFRMPYSLHEKTGLASIVIDKNKIDEFNLNDADPLNVKVKEFIPKCKKDEAKSLLLSALEQYKEKEKPKIKFSSNINSGKSFEPIKIKVIKEENFPPTIQKILKGMNDGKKRSLFILINFFKSLGMEMDDVEKQINEWNKKNNPMLKQGYINAQLIWHSKNPTILPPNFDNPIYKDLGVFEQDNLSMKVKNPVNYVVIKTMVSKKKSPDKK